LRTSRLPVREEKKTFGQNLRYGSSGETARLGSNYIKEAGAHKVGTLIQKGKASFWFKMAYSGIMYAMRKKNLITFH